MPASPLAARQQLLAAALQKLAAPLLLLLAVALVAAAVQACQGPTPAAAAAPQAQPPRTAKLGERRGPDSRAARVGGPACCEGPKRRRRHMQDRSSRWR